MPLKKLALIALCTSMFAFMGCGSGDPIVNFNNSPVVAKSGNKNIKDIERAIMLAGARSGWQMNPVKPGLITATRFSQGHMAKVDISYTTQSYSVTYKDSSNLKYNGQTIDEKYNQWVTRLHKYIRANIAQM